MNILIKVFFLIYVVWLTGFWQSIRLSANLPIVQGNFIFLRGELCDLKWPQQYTMVCSSSLKQIVKLHFVKKDVWKRKLYVRSNARMLTRMQLRIKYLCIHLWNITPVNKFQYLGNSWSDITNVFEHGASINANVNRLSCDHTQNHFCHFFHTNSKKPQKDQQH